MEGGILMSDFDNMITNSDTPAGLIKADIGMRIGAFIIDYIVITTVITCPFLLFSFRNIPGDPKRFVFQLLIFMLATVLVYCLKDVINGASLGK